MELEEAVREPGALRARRRGGTGVRPREGAGGRRLAVGAPLAGGGRAEGCGAGKGMRLAGRAREHFGERLEFLAARVVGEGRAGR